MKHDFRRAADTKPSVFAERNVFLIFAANLGQNVYQAFAEKIKHTVLLSSGDDFLFDRIGKTFGGIGDGCPADTQGHLCQFIWAVK